MDTLTLDSDEHGPIAYSVYTPPGYYTPGNEDRYPVLYFLHGSGGDESSLGIALRELPFAGTTGAEKMDAAILSGQLPPMMLVAIAAPGGGSWDANLLDLVTEEMVGQVDRNYRTIADRRGRSIEGFSSGARGVARYLTPRAELFASASIMGGGFENERWAEHGESIRIRGTRVQVLIGDQDQFLPGAVELVGVLDAEGIEREYVLLPGVPHNCNLIYENYGLENLQFHASAWADASRIEGGPDQVIAGGAPASAAVQSQVLDSGSYAFSWQQIGGPAGGASFAQGDAASTTVDFSQIGTYSLQVTATDANGGSYRDTLRVAVVDLDDSLEMYLPLDTDSFDASGHGRDGVEQGGVGPTATGRIGGAYRFDGIDDVLAVPDFPYGPSYSVAFWFKANDLTGSSYQYMLSHGAFDRVHSINAYLPENATSASQNVRTVLRDVDDSAGQYIDAPGEYEDSVWHHYVKTVSETYTRVYVDGREKVVSSQGGEAFDPTVDLVLGGRSVSPAGRYFDGWLDEVRLYGRSLEPAEAATLGSTGGADLAPVADAGPDLGLQEFEDAILLATVSDDDRSPLAISWSQVSGPGTATFSHPDDASSSVSFDTAGTYVLRIDASDGQGSSSDTLTVSIQSASAPVAYWRLDETAGSLAADASVQGNDGTLLGSTSTAWTGSSLDLDAAAGHAVTFGQPASLDLAPSSTDLSLVAWIRVDPGAQGTILSKAYGSLASRQFQLYLYDHDGNGQSSIYGLIGGKANNSANGVVVDDGQWHLVAVVHDMETMTNLVYVDGQAIGAAKVSGSAVNGVDVMLGARRETASNSGIGWAFDGEIGEARIYAWELSAAEMEALYGQGPS